MAINYKQIYAVKAKNKERILKINPLLDNQSGIYFFTRIDSDDIKYFYIGQSVHCLDRCVEHLMGYKQHIDLSIRKHGLFNNENPYGWKIDVMYYPQEQLDAMERYWILEYTKQGWQCRYNKTSGGQDNGKSKINDYRPAKGYRDGLEQGYKNASKEIAHLFDLHLEVKTKNEKPTVNQQKALDKFNAFLDYCKQTKEE